MYGDVRDELGILERCICEPAVRGSYSGTMMPGCPHHEVQRKAFVAAAFDRVFEQHGPALDELGKL